VQARAGAPGQYDSFHGYKYGERLGSLSSLLLIGPLLIQGNQCGGEVDLVEL
jgi:hypothetical protein